MNPIRSQRRQRLNLETLERRDVPSSNIPLSVTNWTAIGPAPLLGAQTPGNLTATGRAAGLAIDPTNPAIIYVGTAGGGVWKTTNGNATNPTWIPLTDTQASPFIGCVTLAPSNPSIVYVGTGEAEERALSFYGRGILKSTDAGATWTLLGSSVFNRTCISNIIVNPTNPNIVFAAVCDHGTDCDPNQSTGIYRSTDGGLTWTNTTISITTTDDFTDLEPDPTDPNVMWACAGTRLGGPADGVYKCTNILAATPTWTEITNIASGSAVGRTELAIAPSNNQVIYVSMSDTAGNLLHWYQTTNGGTSWTDRVSVAPGTDRMWYSNNLLVDPTNPNLVYFSGTTNLGRSTDGGATWGNINSGANGAGPHVDYHGFAFDSTGRFLVVSDGGCYRYTPSTNLWVSLNGVNSSRTNSGALNTMQFMGIAISPTDPDFVIGGTQDNGLQRFSDSLGWTLPEGGDGGDVIMDPFNSQQMWRANPVGSYGVGAYVRRSTNGGSSWSSIVNGISGTTAAAFYPPMAADPGTQNRIFLGTNRLNVSTDAGSTWTLLPGDTFQFPNELRAIGIGRASASTIYVACGASADGTVGAYSANQLFVTTNNGATWIERTPQLGGDFEAFAVDPTNSNIAYVVSANFSPTGDNIWKTTDAGQTWTSLSANLPDAPFYDVLLDPGATNSNTDDILYVGGDLGVYRSTDLGATWSKFGNGLAISQVRDLEYSPQTHILAAATHGRGIWEILAAPPAGQIFGTVYNDTNSDAVLDNGEAGLGGWTVFRDDNNNGVLETYGTSNVGAPGLPIALPDHMTTTSTLTTSGLSGAIIDVNLTLNITHARDSDLQIYLTDPFGTQILLIPSSNATGQNFSNTVFDDEASTEITSASAPYSGTFRPVQPLSAMDGQSPNGTWTLTVNDTRTSNSGTLNSWSIGVATGEPRAVSAPDGTYALRGNPPGTYSLRRVLQSGWFATQPLGGAASVTLGSALGAANVNFGQTQNPPVQVSSVSVNAGAAQRSRVTTIAVTFSQLVNLPANPADAFLLTRNGGGTVTFTAMASVVNGVTVVTLDNFTGAETEFGSLRDGRYTMTILANQVSNSFGQLDGNGDGIAGDNFTFGDNQGLFRYFGDVNGDQVVNGFDLGLFRNAFGTAAGDPNYLSYFDFNGDGVINGFDLGQFRTRFGTMLP